MASPSSSPTMASPSSSPTMASPSSSPTMASPSSSPTMASPSSSPTMASPSPSQTNVPRRRSKTGSKKAILLPSYADLPSSLLEIIMSHLVLKDNIRASAACKPWREAAVSVRVVEKHPWLMCFPKRGNLIELRDPLHWKLYTLDLPELANSTVCYSRDGWLLMRRSVSNDIFFFNPFSRELIISLPKLDPSFDKIAFSCSPTSDNCVLAALTVTRYSATIRTCHPGATEWIADDFPVPIYEYSNLVYANDRFYFVTGGQGILYSFRPSSRAWKCHEAAINPPKEWKWYHEVVFLAEKKGKLFLIFTYGNKKPMVYKLVFSQWKEMSSTNALDGLTIFVSFYNSVLRTDLPWMRNNVYFSRFGYNCKRCVSYSFDESAYNPRKDWHDWQELISPQSVWIDPPKNVLDYF